MYFSRQTALIGCLINNPYNFFIVKTFLHFSFFVLFCTILCNLVSIATDLEKKVADAFLIFDHQGNKTVDVREIGTILRYLGKFFSLSKIDGKFNEAGNFNFLTRLCPIRGWNQWNYFGDGIWRFEWNYTFVTVFAACYTIASWT